MYKYIAYRNERGYWAGQVLLPPAQLASMVKLVSNQGLDTFLSMQDYDKDGNCLGSLIFADFDSKDIKESYDDAIAFIEVIEQRYGIEAILWFSGNKGFHVCVPYYVAYADAHYRIAQFVKTIGEFKTLDMAIYTERRLLRVEGSVHSKSGIRKTRITGFPTIDEIRKIANVKQPFIPYIRVSNAALSEFFNSVPEIKKFEPIEAIDYSIRPCIKALLREQASEGSRNSIVTVVTVEMAKAGFTIDECISTIMASSFGTSLAIKKVEAVARSIYRRGVIRGIGCKNGAYASLLKPHCNKLCPCNKEEICFATSSSKNLNVSADVVLTTSVRY